MDLTLDFVNQRGGFGGPPVKREVSWTHEGETVTAEVHIRPLPYSEILDTSGAKETASSIVARRVAKSVCHPDGSPVFQVSDLTGVKEDGTPVMVKVDGKMVERGPLNPELYEGLALLVSEESCLGKRKS